MRGDAREFLHAQCDCVPRLGPAHCHLCGVGKDSPVEWKDCAAVSEVERAAAEKAWDEGEIAGYEDALAEQRGIESHEYTSNPHRKTKEEHDDQS